MIYLRPWRDRRVNFHWFVSHILDSLDSFTTLIVILFLESLDSYSTLAMVSFTLCHWGQKGSLRSLVTTARTALTVTLLMMCNVIFCSTSTLYVYMDSKKTAYITVQQLFWKQNYFWRLKRNEKHMPLQAHMDCKKYNKTQLTEIVCHYTIGFQMFSAVGCVPTKVGGHLLADPTRRLQWPWLCWSALLINPSPSSEE